MRLLWIATKSPWPPVDGGRLLLLRTLEGLAARGVAVTLVVPGAGSAESRSELRRGLSPLCRPVLVPAVPRSWPLAALVAARRRWPITIARHSLARVRREAARALAGEAPEAVLVQPLQAWTNAPPGRAPLLFRPENVESELWAALGARIGGVRGAALVREARRLARFEAMAVRQSARTLALSDEDRVGLAALAGGGERIEVVRPPFPAELPAGEPLAGAPALVLAGSGGWSPNADADRWFLGEVWPRVREVTPGARLHRFGGKELGGEGLEGLEQHRAPTESRGAFPRGAIAVLPLRVGSGVRLRLLEAWARGLAVVGTPVAVRGLSGRDGEEWLLAADAEGFARAVARLAAEPELAAAMVAAGRRRLVAEHDPRESAERLESAIAERASLER